MAQRTLRRLVADATPPAGRGAVRGRRSVCGQAAARRTRRSPRTPQRLRASRGPQDAAKIRNKVKITIETATPSAKAKVEAAGGSITAPAT